MESLAASLCQYDEPKEENIWNFSERQAKQNEQEERQDNYVIVNQIFTK